MALAVRAFISGTSPTTNGGADTTTCSATFGAAPTAGDLLVLAYNTAATTTPTFTPPTGFTELTGADNACFNTGNNYGWIGTKVSDGTETTLTFTTSVAGPASIVVWDIESPAASAPVDLTGLGANSAGGTTTYSITSGSGTATEVGELILLAGFSNSYASSVTTPPGFTLDADIGNYDAGFVGANISAFHSAALTTSTAIPAQTLTWSGGGYSGYVSLGITQFTIKPVVGKPINVADTGATVSDALSVAQMAATQTAADVGATVADAPVIHVTSATGSKRVPHIPWFRRGFFR